ncbi:ribosomal-protein-alanine N-acetyltransferase [Corticibacter populi]|uniref:[Ribosomal protein bS18]-alanine N-acetyltransferase n=2 Tax=Corticibacter populi TaxID=1550736 RepID=A0A3M6QRJ7_9BURK|nr:ribosomal-protein-alanine N-acetyltransferase [Corticibacter populi]
MGLADLDAVMVLEQASHSHPWTRGNFSDSLKGGFHIPLLLRGDVLLGYFVAMPGVDEVHLLNVTVAPGLRRQGLGRVLMAALEWWARRLPALQIWLEVRRSNGAAQALYRDIGYEEVAWRRNYYPLDGQQREDALVMRKLLPYDAPDDVPDAYQAQVGAGT